MIRISFSGIDGCGKSTQIALLQERLAAEGRRVVSFHLFSSGQSVMSSAHATPAGRWIVSTIRAIKRHPLGGGVEFLARLANVVLDSWATTRKNRRLDADVIIYDRYFFDVLACIVRDHPRARGLVHFVARWLIQRPEVPLFLTAPPRVTVDRKQEHTLASALVQTNIYHELSRSLGVDEIDSAQPVEAVFACILSKVPASCAAESRTRERQ